MRFLIIGDSWGCGEWGKEFVYSDSCPKDFQPSNEPNKWHRSYIVRRTHIGEYLTQLGHRCLNICIGGDSNINQLKRLQSRLEKSADFDRIIWFHTEPVRDWQARNYILSEHDYREQLTKPKGFDDIINFWYTSTYDLAQAIYDKYKIPFMMIGGMTAIPEHINRYTFYDFILKDWANEMILDRPCLHPDNTGQIRHFIEHFIDVIDPEWALAETRSCDVWLQTCASHPRFPDWGHPDRICHEQLARYIHELPD